MSVEISYVLAGYVLMGYVLVQFALQGSLSTRNP
jgi:hypothetical protein